MIGSKHIVYSARDKIIGTGIFGSTHHVTSMTNRLPKLISLPTSILFVSQTIESESYLPEFFFFITAIKKYRSINPITESLFITEDDLVLLINGPILTISSHFEFFYSCLNFNSCFKIDILLLYPSWWIFLGCSPALSLRLSWWPPHLQNESPSMMLLSLRKRKVTWSKLRWIGRLFQYTDVLLS